MVKNIDKTNNYLLKLIEKQRNTNVSMYTVPVFLAKFEQTLYPEWVWYFSFLFVISKVLSNDFKVFLSHIIMAFFKCDYYVRFYVRFVISSIVVFNAFMSVTCSFTNVVLFTCCYKTDRMTHQIVLVLKICFVFDGKLATEFLWLLWE